MKSRIAAFLLILSLLLVGFSAVAAQDNTDCLGLSADDCTIITAANANLESVTSFTQSFNFSLNVGGLAAMGGSDIAVSADGSGPFVFDPTAADPTAGLGMALDINGSATSDGETDSGTFSLVIVDGVFYAQNPQSGQWEGMTLADLQSQMGGMMGGEPGAAMDPTAMMGDLPPEAMQAIGALASLDPMSIPGFLSQVRLTDEAVNGVNSAVFEFTIDLAPLLASEEFQTALNSAVEAAAEADPSAAQAAMMVPMLQQGLTGTVKFTRWIGIADQIPQRVSFAINGAFDLSAMMGGSSSGGQQMDPITLDMNLTVDLSAVNATAAPTAPEGAVMQEATS